MKVLLTISTLFCLFINSSALAQSSPYIDRVTYSVEPASNVVVMPTISQNAAQPYGYQYTNTPPPSAISQNAAQPYGYQYTNTPPPPTIPQNAAQPYGYQYTNTPPPPRPTPHYGNKHTGGYLDYIRSQGKIRCGTNTKLKSYAYLEDDVWHGIDADICKAIALAIIGDADKIEMINVEPDDVEKALANGQIDVMLSGKPFREVQEINGKVESAGLIYYDQQLLMVADKDQEPEFYRGKKMCITTGSDYYRKFEEYNTKHDLNVSYLTFGDMDKVKEAFLLKRCQMITASALYLSGLKQSMMKTNAKIYPDQIALIPVHALVRAHNRELRLAVKWILNALFLAEQYGINGQNLTFFTSHNNQEIRNLVGDDPKLWQGLGLRSFWLIDAIRLLGNYGDIYNRNIGEDSDYKIERRQGKLVKDGGLIYPIPFM